MRRSRTVRRGASAFRWVTLVVSMAVLVAVLASDRGAAAAEPPGVLRHLAGCFEVSYRFVEDGVHDKDIRGDLLEEITLEAHDGVYAFQHYGIFKGQRLPRAMMPKCLKYKTRIWAIMLKNFRISSSNGRLDPHLAQGYWKGYVETFPHTQ